MALTNIETTIILDLYDHDTTPTKIKAIALDSKTRYVLASLRNNGNVYDAGQDTSVTLTIIRPDNVGVQITGETRQIVDLAPEGEVTVYGVYAELTQTALAVKGTLRAQFMLTSGDQVLRTEIFAISCGEALDASTDTWAGEYQGYNLDELVQNVNESVAKVDVMEQDVSDLKSGLGDLKEDLNTVFDLRYKTPDAIADNYGIKANGYAVYNTNFHFLKYSVTEGDSVWIKCNEAWNGKAAYIFQDSASVSQSNIDHLIGTPCVNATDGFVTVPQGATWLIIAPPKTETESGVYSATIIEDVQRAKESINDIKNDVFTVDKEITWNNGFISTQGKATSSSASVYAVVRLLCGETVAVGTINKNITIIGATPNDSVAIGESIYPIYVTPNSNEYISYEYTALQDINIVICVLKTNYSLRFYRSIGAVQRQINAAESRIGNENLVGNVPDILYPIEAQLNDLFTASNGTGNNFASGTEIHFYDENKQHIAYWGLGGYSKRVIRYTPSTQAKYVAVHQSNFSRQQIMLNRGIDALDYAPYLRGSVVESLSDKSVNIVDLNSGLLDKICYATKLRYGYATAPLVLLHFSDIHGSATNLKRMIELLDSLGALVDDAICTGDMVNNSFSDGFDWWNVDGAENILLCIGNHDVTDGVDYNNYGGTTPEGAYNTYFAPYIANWNVNHTGTLTYYYKDFSDKKIRLIALDYLLTGDEANSQNTWLQTVLADAQTNDYTVVIIQHCPVSNQRLIDSGFTMLGRTSSQTFPVMYQQSVKTFMDNGGKFACYLTGHTHWDMICYNNDFPDQLCICVSCAITTGRDGDQYRDYNTKAQDAANVVVIDTTTKTVKLIRVGADMDYYLRPRNELAISYETKEIIAQR